MPDGCKGELMETEIDFTVEVTKTKIFDMEPCPFCGQVAFSTRGDKAIQIFCRMCGTYGPFGNSVDDAAERWNKRHKGDHS